MKQDDGRIVWKNLSDLKLILLINQFIEKHGIKSSRQYQKNYQRIQILHQVCGLLIKNMDHGKIYWLVLVWRIQNMGNGQKYQKKIIGNSRVLYCG